MPFLSPVKLEPVERRWWIFTRTYWRVAEPFSYLSYRHSVRIDVPEGFVSDGPSAPKWLPIVYGLFGTTAFGPATVHDFIYHNPPNDKQNDLLPRAVCDDIFDEAMIDDSVSDWQRRDMWIGVRIGGWTAYGKKP